MAEYATLARPYAEAIFELAKDTGTLDVWSDNLAYLTTIVTEPTMVAIIANPRVEKATLTKLMLDIGGDLNTSQELQNLIRLLIDNRRLSAVPRIAEQYEQLKAQHQGYLKVEITSSYPVSPDQQQHIETVLQKRLGKAVDINITIDQSLLGGWLIRAGDEVIDLTLKGRLDRLATGLRH
jgi:F-type H+-transporting ATPase subunit delta